MPKPKDENREGKVGRVRRWNMLRSQLRHQGIVLFILRRLP